MEGDSDANYAHFALQKLHIRPREFIEMDPYERAFVCASIKVRLEAEKKVRNKAKKKI